MRRTASEILSDLEIRVARLEKQSSMRTAGLIDFDEAWGAVPRYKKKKRVEKLDAVELPSGEKAIVATKRDMANFLEYLGYYLSQGRWDNMKRESGKLYILESDSNWNRERYHLFVVTEKEIRKDPKKRIGYNFYN